MLALAGGRTVYLYFLKPRGTLMSRAASDS